MVKTKKLVLFGDSAFGEVAYELFTHDSEYEVVAFTVNKEFLKKDTLFGLPVVPYEDIEKLYPPSQYDMHIALVYNTLNRTRAKFYHDAKPVSYTHLNWLTATL